MRRIMAMAAAGSLLAALGGCVAIGSIDKRAVQFNQSVARAQNVAILLNIVRASRSEPLYFLAINKMSGSGSETFRVALPAVTVGPNRSPSQSNYTFPSNLVDSGASGSFDMGVLGSKEFYSGLMAPLGLAEVNLLLNQGYSRELVFRLVIDRITIRSEDGVNVLRNDPRDASYALFESYIRDAVERGLTTEAVVDPSGRPRTQLCYDDALMSRETQQFMAAVQAKCGVPRAPTPEGDDRLTVTLRGKPQSIQVSTRSINAVFGALGKQVGADPRGEVMLRHAEWTGGGGPEPLLRVATGVRTRCFVAASYAGEAYCVPEEAGDNSRRVFSILNALVALKTAPGDLPMTPTVRITP